MALLRKHSSALLTKVLKFSNLSITKNAFSVPLRYGGVPSNPFKHLGCDKVAAFHSSAKLGGLSEFFDDKKNWGESEIKVGRSWRLEELRIKSNEDLHKLWYVLLKEKNMLLTMEHACKEEYRLFPSPERIDKIHLV